MCKPTNSDVMFFLLIFFFSNSRPAQKLFSELIREAHVSLQRCNLDQLGLSGSTSSKPSRTNTKTKAVRSSLEDVSKRKNTSGKTHSEARKNETVITKRNFKENKSNYVDNARTDCASVNVAVVGVSQKSSVDSKQQCEPEEQSEVKAKQPRKSLLLPLPALALFLKQHSSKSKKNQTKPDCCPSTLPSESLSESQSSSGPSSCQTSCVTVLSKDCSGADSQSDRPLPGCARARPRTSDMPFNVGVRADGSVHSDPKELATEDLLTSIPVAESQGSVVTHGRSVLSNVQSPFHTMGTSVYVSSTAATSSPSSILSSPLDTVLHAPNSPLSIAESSTLSSDYPNIQSDSLLSDPECSFGFEPYSPPSSPELLPSLPASVPLRFNPTTSEPVPKASPAEESQLSQDSAASVFKWHTVLPPADPYMDAPFTAIEPMPRTLPSTTPQPESETFNTSTSPPDCASPFSESEQSLPFPAELSPLALHLSLSPTFSSLDADALSPTPSLTDLVQFFSANDLAIGMDFSNTDQVPVPSASPSTDEGNAHETSQQVQPVPANKSNKRKKSGRRNVAKTDVNQSLNDSTYTQMQPNLDKVEEQLFISFTSKVKINNIFYCHKYNHYYRKYRFEHQVQGASAGPDSQCQISAVHQ